MTTFAKGDRVEFTHKQEGIITGMVIGPLRDGRVGIRPDNNPSSSWKVPSSILRPTLTPAPIREPNPFALGQRVEIADAKGTVYTGPVTSIRDEMVKITIEGEVGATFRAHFSKYRPTTRPAPEPVEITYTRTDPPTPVDAYSVIKFKPMAVRPGRWEGHEGNGIRDARIVLAGKEIIKVYNEGVGGPNQYEPINGASQKDVADFLDSCKIWYRLCSGKESDFCTDELFIEWYVQEKPQGVPAWMYLE